jgi:hypothetical protein
LNEDNDVFFDVLLVVCDVGWGEVVDFVVGCGMFVGCGVDVGIRVDDGVEVGVPDVVGEVSAKSPITFDCVFVYRA